LAISIFDLHKHRKPVPVRIDITPVANITDTSVAENRAYTYKHKYKPVKWALATKGRCAVVGGGVGVKNYLDKLRNFNGDIYAINDAAKYLSDNGIKCCMYSIDGSKVPYKKGKNCTTALFSRRVHKIQLKRFRKKNVRVFEMFEEDKENGVEGGVSALCRAPHVFIKMGYIGVDFYGCEGSFHDESHNTGNHDDAHSTKLIITADGVDYMTSAAFLLQNQYMVPVFLDKQLSKYLTYHGGGLLRAMMEHPDTWSVSAVSDAIKEQSIAHGTNPFSDQYKTSNKLWKP